MPAALDIPPPLTPAVAPPAAPPAPPRSEDTPPSAAPPKPPNSAPFRGFPPVNACSPAPSPAPSSASAPIVPAVPAIAAGMPRSAAPARDRRSDRTGDAGDCRKDGRNGNAHQLNLFTKVCSNGSCPFASSSLARSGCFVLVPVCTKPTPRSASCPSANLRSSLPTWLCR